MTLRSRDFETGPEASAEVGRSRKQTDREGESGGPGSPSLFLIGVGRQGLLHNSLHSPEGGVGPRAKLTSII